MVARDGRSGRYRTAKRCAIWHIALPFNDEKDGRKTTTMLCLWKRKGLHCRGRLIITPPEVPPNDSRFWPVPANTDHSQARKADVRNPARTGQILNGHIRGSALTLRCRILPLPSGTCHALALGL